MSEATTPSPDAPAPSSSSSDNQGGAAGERKGEDEEQQEPLEGEAEVTKSFREEFDKIYQGYGRDYVKKVMDMAKQSTYTITLMVPDPGGKKEPDPFDEGKEREVYVGSEPKQYKRRPISAMDFHRAEKLRAKFQNEKDPDKVADNQARIYQFLAFCYLGMSPTEFSRVADWTELKLAIDACNHRTVYQPGSGSN